MKCKNNGKVFDSFIGNWHPCECEVCLKPRNVKIKTCPFCGELPEKSTMITDRGKLYFLECTNDDCPTHTLSVGGDLFEQSAINKWNTRKEKE